MNGGTRAGSGSRFMKCGAFLARFGKITKHRKKLEDSMKTPTIYDIKHDVQDNEPYFFDRKSMRVFGQTMKDFKVRRSPAGRIFIYAPMFLNGKPLGVYTVREYKDRRLVYVHGLDTLADITEYIQVN
jgi:hypothetical protein